MSTEWWTTIYVATAVFLVWLVFGRGLKTLFGGVLADLLIEGPEHMNDRTIRRTAAVILVFETIWFVAGLMYPAIRWP